MLTALVLEGQWPHNSLRYLVLFDNMGFYVFKYCRAVGHILTQGNGIFFIYTPLLDHANVHLQSLNAQQLMANTTTWMTVKLVCSKLLLLITEL
jgi:hypothetical protein